MYQGIHRCKLFGQNWRSRAFQREPGDQASASQGLGQVEQASSFSRLFHPSSAILYYFRPLGGSNVTWQFRSSEIEYRFERGKAIGESLLCAQKLMFAEGEQKA